jgi:hypothetical protein
MALATVPHQSSQSQSPASKAIPFVVPAQLSPKTETISQTELTLLLSLRGRLHQLESQVETAEQSIKQRLEQGAAVEPGDHTAKIETSYRRNVSWKSVAERLADRFKLNGEAFVARVLAATRPTPAISLEIN